MRPSLSLGGDKIQHFRNFLETSRYALSLLRSHRQAKKPNIHTRDCPDHRKSVRQEIIEGEFETLLAALKPSAHLFHAIYEMLRDQWNDRLARSE